MPLTGYLEPFGAAGQQAADLAADEIRKAAAKAGAQHKITITHVDYKSDPGTVKKAAQKLAKDGSSCLVGPWAAQVERVAKLVAIPNRWP